MVLIFFSRCHVFYPLFHLSGLPFSFFVNNLTFFSFINIFYSFSPFFIPHRHFTPFSRLSLPLPPVFILFAHVYTTFSPFQSFFAFSQLIFIFFCFFRLFHRFTPSFCHFFRSSFIFSFLLMSLFPSHFSRFTSLKMFHVKHRFYDFRSSAISEKRFASRLSENCSHFSPLLFFKTIVFSILFLIFPSFLHFSCIFACFTQFFVSAFSLLLNYLIIFLYFRMN